ncbi:MAG: hypothetical protein JWP27_1813 [Flaviaesturariibacter sp.]|nr:hypothetical protein [Flaviaesturariibacter sp.]
MLFYAKNQKMRVVLFLSRIAFICNVFFLVAVLLRFANGLQNGVFVSTVVIMGYFLVVLFNPLVNLIYGVLLLRRRLPGIMPKWLVLANFIFLLLQLQYILFLNDTLHS